MSDTETEGRGSPGPGGGPADGAPRDHPDTPGPASAAVAGLAPLLQVCVAVVAAALLVAVVPWSGAELAARAGVGLLLAAPYLATLSAAVHYARERTWTEAALATLLLALLVAGLWLGTGRTP